MNRERIIFLTIFGFGSGVAIRSFFNFSFSSSALVIVIALFFLLFWRVRNREFFAIIALFFFALGLGMLRYVIADKHEAASELSRPLYSSTVIRGVVSEEPDEREAYTRIVLRADEFMDWNTKKWITMRGDKILVTAHHYPLFRYGDVLRLHGELQEPNNINDFDWKSFLAKENIFLEMHYPRIQYEGERKMSFLGRALFSFKEKYLGNLSRLMPEPQASFMAGLTVGARSSMPKNITEEFRKTGVSHIIALSGYNVSIIANAVASFLRLFLPWTVSVSAGIVGIIVFAFLTGASATVVRASIMAILIYIAQASGRVYYVSVALFVAGFLMLLYNPKLLRFDMSFQLSFLATLGLLYLSPRLQRFFVWVPKRFSFREITVSTLSAQVAVTPILLYITHSFSLVSLPSNFFVLITIPAAMFFGFLAGLSGFISLFLGIPFAWVASIILSYNLSVIHFFAGLPLAVIAAPFF